ncbi:hypothetical protein [Sandaracinobacteroides hominis]|uniref:hypothetical protein n=1 Tax=Sandaracinobacteroides hominis TaxID=2780086 RepID=UPI0018F3A3A3|nr:hypothetical protein [Sandaracinobacteroides hominis]
MRPALFAAALMLFAPVAAQADAVLDRILADSARAPIPAIERTSRAELRADPEKEPALVVDRFTPTGARSGKWTLVNFNGHKPTPKEIDRHAKANPRNVVPGFHRLSVVLRTPPTKQSQANGRTVYHWASLPEGAVVTPGGDISSRLSADLTVEDVDGKPTPVRVRIYSPEPFKIRGIATMNRFEVISNYRPGATYPFLASQTSDSDVSAPFGFGGRRKSEISFRPL